MKDVSRNRMNQEILSALRRRVASTSVGPSTARGMGPKGTIKAARKFLRHLDLGSFAKKTEKEFQVVIDQATQQFAKYLPKGARHWGAARKFLNIFLRDCVYNRFLCEYYKLCAIEQWLELPLDSHVAKGLHEEKGGNLLPRWKGVIYLDKETNQKYQVFAAEVARLKDTYRVHLDVLYFRKKSVAANTSFRRSRRITPRR